MKAIGKTETTVKRVKFWTRIKRAHSDEWALVEGVDESAVPLKAWKAFNKAFWNAKTTGKLYPLDELEAYQFAAREMVRASARVRGVKGATSATYLVSAAFRALKNYRQRNVERAREEYRILGGTARVGIDGGDPTSARGEDRADREWSDTTVTTLDVAAFVESLPGTHAYDGVTAARRAAVCVAETLPRLDADAQRGLRAWLDADGVLTDAAKIYDPDRSVQSYTYRFKHIWSRAFRKACTWVW